MNSDPLSRLAAHCNNLHSPTAPSLPVSSPLGGALPLSTFTPADAYSVERAATGFQPWRYSLYTNTMALSDAMSPTGSRHCVSDKHQDTAWFRGPLPSFPPPPPTPEVHESQRQPAHALSGFTSGFTSGGFGEYSSSSYAPVHPAMHIAAVAHHLGDSLYSPTGNSFCAGNGGPTDAGRTLSSGGYGDMTTLNLGPPALPMSSANLCCLESPRNSLGAWPGLDGPVYAGTAATSAVSQTCCNGASRYFSPWQLAPLSTSADNKLSVSKHLSFVASSPSRKTADSNKPSSKSRQSVPRRRAGVTAAVGSSGRGSSSCDCPNCREAERVGGVVGEQLRRLGQHSCHVPGCGKVYAKTSHLKAHLHWHSGERPFVCSWLHCGKRFTRADELQRHLSCHAAADHEDGKHRAADNPARQQQATQNTGSTTTAASVATGGVKTRQPGDKTVSTNDVTGSDNQQRKRANKRHSSTASQPQTQAAAATAVRT